MPNISIDLHGVKHADVKRHVTHFIEDHWDSSETLDIITGHSNPMRCLVQDVLEEYNLKGYVNHTCIRIYPSM